ncbi:hypothetical protein K491DRAFT_714509 [Lophiostoma macrostomum CBS 122681]|uniref:Uncharacterized protein n=1 Tax=Lophiostoma macrostomum CBS 122681 TaxID=1314788 RepID=A0A6A6TBY1_9PLEO|nr:hypothetical protein K491DRAFT_714509 [Lophiostoma macrostomum CBS 122681]
MATKQPNSGAPHDSATPLCKWREFAAYWNTTMLKIPASTLHHGPNRTSPRSEVIKKFLQALDAKQFSNFKGIMDSSFKDNYEHVGQKEMSEFLVEVGKKWNAEDPLIRDVVKQGQGDAKYWKKIKAFQDLKVEFDNECHRRIKAHDANMEIRYGAVAPM